MVRTHSDTQQISNLTSKLEDSDESYSKGDRIKIADDFQRGNEETGIWSNKQRVSYIDSVEKGYPTSTIILVKDYIKQHKTPWSVLDGGNRCRAIRDYKNNKFTNTDGKKYCDLDDRGKAKFDSTLLPCQWITIEKNDPSNTISEMFTRLNTKASPLSSGELTKAHGWKKNIVEIEIAKKMVGDGWQSAYKDDEEIISIKKKWEEVFSIMSETKRCSNLAMICGYIISAKTADFKTFDSRYERIKNYFSKPDENLKSDTLNIILRKIHTFLDVIREITDKSIFGKLNKGVPPKNKISPIWFCVCSDKLRSKQVKSKIITFYNVHIKKSEVLDKYNSLFKDSNSETPIKKMERIIAFIINSKIE